MSRFGTAAGVMLAFASTGVAFAGPGLPCDQAADAWLARATRPQLLQARCRAQQRADTNAELRAAVATQEQRRGEAAALGDAQVACLRLAEAAAGELERRFGVRHATCPPAQ